MNGHLNSTISISNSELYIIINKSAAEKKPAALFYSVCCCAFLFCVLLCLFVLHVAVPQQQTLQQATQCSTLANSLRHIVQFQALPTLNRYLLIMMLPRCQD